MNFLLDLRTTKRDREKHIEINKQWAAVYYYPLYKTAIVGDIPHTYQVVTRVNYLTAQLWLVYRNSKVVNGSKGFVKLPDAKPNWLVMVGGFRRMQDRKIKVLDYLKERANRIKL